MNILFSLCWLGDQERVNRYEKWLNYHLAIKNELGFDHIFLVDNASPPDNIEKLQNAYKNDVTVYSFIDHLPRFGGLAYPYCWRGMDWAKKAIRGFTAKKMIFLDSDFYVLTPKLAKYIKELDTGWTAMWCPKYEFPEAALHVLCEDSFPLLVDFPIPSYTHYNGQHMEKLLPFTHIEKDFVGDRYGETKEPQTNEMDFYGQWDATCGEMVYDCALLSAMA